MESPVTTVYRIAPNAAAAIVPIAYSIVEYYTRLIPDRAGGHVDAARPGWITS